MTPHTIPDSLYTLALIDGYPTTINGQAVPYKTVRLRETLASDLAEAVRMAERVVVHQGKPLLLVSEPDYQLAMTLRHIVAFKHPTAADIGADILTLASMGKLNPYDLARIQERVLIIELAAQVRYGLISEQAFDEAYDLAMSNDSNGNNNNNAGGNPLPRRTQQQGQGSRAGAVAGEHRLAVEILASHAGAPATGTATGVA